MSLYSASAGQCVNRLLSDVSRRLTSIGEHTGVVVGFFTRPWPIYAWIHLRLLLDSVGTIDRLLPLIMCYNAPYAQRLDGVIAIVSFLNLILSLLLSLLLFLLLLLLLVVIVVGNISSRQKLHIILAFFF